MVIRSYVPVYGEHLMQVLARQADGCSRPQMSASVLTPSIAAQTERFSGTRWIISQHDDLIWFVGTALVGYLALALMSAGVSLTLLTAVWILGVDGPHVTGTVTRTYFDKQERRRLGWLLWALIPLLFIGPLAVVAGQ